MYFALSLALILLRTPTFHHLAGVYSRPSMYFFPRLMAYSEQMTEGPCKQLTAQFEDGVQSIFGSRFICKIDERVPEREAASYQSYYIEFRSISSVQRTGSSHHEKSAPQWMSIMPAKACSRGPVLIDSTVDRRGQQALSPYYRNNSRPTIRRRAWSEKLNSLS